jgi:hypothetical protein
MNHLLVLIYLLTAGVPAVASSLRVLAWDQEISERKLAIGCGKEVTDVGYMHPAARSAPIKVPVGAENLRLVALDRKNADGSPAAVPLVIGSEIKIPLLLVIPDEKSTSGVRVIVIEDDRQSFHWGTIRLINVTPKPLAFRWEKEARVVPTGWKPVDVSPGGKSRNMGILIYLKDDLKNPLYTAVWEHREDMRQLVFVTPNPDQSLGAVAFKFIPETRIAAEGGTE